MKIDYVIPYVDSTDPIWLKQYMKMKKYNENANNINEVKKRFSPNILFKYQFRGIEKFMPWINVVHLLVQSESQIPKWLNRSNVHIVYHEQFMPQEFLPTYNSSTFECFLHLIPNLETCFIYANDDTYITNKLCPNDFFDGAMPLNSFHLSHVNPKNTESFQRMNMKITKFIFNELGLAYEPYTMCLPHHVQKAMNKVIYKKIFDKYEKYIRSKATMFRTDDNLSQAFFTMYYMLLTKLKYKKSIPFRRFDIFSQFDDIMYFFTHTKHQDFPKLLCINNNDNKKDIMILHMMEKMFPSKSKYEN